MIHTIAMYATANRVFATYNLDGHSITDIDIWPSTTTAKVVIKTDGRVFQLTEGGTSQIDSTFDWVIPNDRSQVGAFEVRYTLHSGNTLNAPPAAEDTWLELTTDLAYGLSHGSKFSQTATFTVEIRPLGGGDTLASGVYVTYAENIFI